MSFLDHLDQIFDLDMARTTLSSPSTADDGDHSSTAKLSDSISFGQQSRHQIELPIVTAAVGVCTVCLESFKPYPEANRVVPCCGHVFHGTCIRKWLSLHNFCPLCRFHIAVQASCE